MRKLILLAVLALAGCDKLAQQPRDDAFGATPLFAGGQVNQAPPSGTIAQEDAAWRAAETTRPPMSPTLLARGQARYAIACTQCHGATGDGDGVVPARGFPRPQPFASLHDLTAGHVVDVITHGYGVMYPHADRVLPADRWAIAAYVQALQLSQSAPVARLSPADLAKLEAGHAQ